MTAAWCGRGPQIGLLLCLLLAAAPASAQLPSPVTAPTVPAGWTITPSMAVASLWDTNVPLGSSDIAGEEGRRPVIGDYVTAVSPSAALDYRGRRSTMGLGYLGTYDIHRQLNEFDAAEHRARADVQRQLGRHVSLFVRDAFTTTPTTDIVAPTTGLLSLRRRTTHFNDFRSGIDIATSPRTNVVLAYASQWVKMAREELVSPLLRGGHSHMADVTLRRRASERLTYGGTYTAQRAIVADGGEIFDVQNAGGFVEAALQSNLMLSASAGYAWLGAGREGDRRHAPAFRVALGSIRSRLIWQLAYGRSFMPSFGFGGTVENEELSGSLQMPIGRLFRLSSVVAFRDNESLQGTRANLRTITSTSRFTWMPARWLHIEVFALQSSQDAQVTGGQISRTRAGVRVSTLHPMRLR